MKYFIALALLFSINVAQAQSYTTSPTEAPCCDAGSTSTATSSSGSQASNVAASMSQGGSVNIGGSALSPSLTIVNSASDLGDQVPAAISPALTASFSSTCFGSASFGVGISGLGLSGGRTYNDLDCQARQNASFLQSMGFTDIAVEIICSRPNVWEASQRVAKMRDATALCGGMDPTDGDYSATKTMWEIEQQISLQARLEKQDAFAGNWIPILGVSGKL